MIIYGKCVNELYAEVLSYVKVADLETIEGRTGKVHSLMEPLTICNKNPRQRVLFDEARNANPFFHLLEAVWMFSGRDDLWITKFNKNMAQFSEGTHFHGAYGARWVEQVPKIVNMLTADHTTRRAYLSLWNATLDLGAMVKDVPCNVGISFQVIGGKLNAYVYNRSNDIIWGMLGSNIVHFSMLLELVADLTSIPMGMMFQTSCNAHYYERHEKLVEDYIPEEMEEYGASTYPLQVMSYRGWVADCNRAINGVIQPAAYIHQFFPDVVLPMIAVWEKRGDLKDIKAEDWRIAAKFWLRRNRK